MKVKDERKYCCFDYPSYRCDGYQLGDIVINEENQIGVIIQIHDANGFEYRTDMFGNCCDDQIRYAESKEIREFRPELLTNN